MKGTIFNIKHFAVHDGPGIRQTVFLKGCPLNCWWCHNPESQNPKPEKYTKTTKLDGTEFKKEDTVGYFITTQELFNIIQGDKIFFEESEGGVTFSGGEPLMQTDFLHEILTFCKKSSIHTCVDTTGFASLEKIKKVAELADCFLYDIKLIDNFLHQKFTGVHVNGIIDNLKWLDENNKNVILRFPVIPGITDTKKNISELILFLKSLRNINQIDLLPYHNISNRKYKRFKMENRMNDTKPLSDKDMQALRSEFESTGFKVGIGG